MCVGKNSNFSQAIKFDTVIVHIVLLLKLIYIQQFFLPSTHITLKYDIIKARERERKKKIEEALVLSWKDMHVGHISNVVVVVALRNTHVLFA
jgi:hypothetical protein